MDKDKTFGEYLDYKINVFLKHYKDSYNSVPEFMDEAEWDSIIANMVELSDKINQNNQKLSKGLLISNTDAIDNIEKYFVDCDLEISHIEAESFAFRENLFKLINEYWIYLD